MLNINDSSSALPSALDNRSPAAAAPADPRYAAKATEAAVKFEAFFISHMLRQMSCCRRPAPPWRPKALSRPTILQRRLINLSETSPVQGNNDSLPAHPHAPHSLPAAGAPVAAKSAVKTDNIAAPLNKSV